MWFKCSNNNNPETSGQWLMTKNDASSVKVAVCDENETLSTEKNENKGWSILEEGIQEIKLDPGRPVQSIRNLDQFKIGFLFISDLLKVKDVNGIYVLNDMRFKKVLICGTIIGKSFNERNYYLQDDDFILDYIMRAINTQQLIEFNINPEMWAAGQVQVERHSDQPLCPNAQEKLNTLLLSEPQSKVDDNTSSIRCVISKDNLNKLKNEEGFNEIKSSFDSCDEVDKIMLDMIKKLSNFVPSWNDLNVGDVIKVIGCLREYNNLRYVFINEINLVPNQSASGVLNSHLSRLKSFYEKM